MDKKISELDQALLLNNDADFPLSQDNGGEPTTFRAKLTQLATKIAEDMTFSNLQTTSKKLVGAINELLSLGSPIIIGTTAPTSSQGADSNIYVQYTEGTGGADDEVEGIYVKIDGVWCEIQTGGGSGAGGHTIVDYAGTSLPQRTKLQFLGAYSEDNSTDDTTEVNVVREMTKAEFDLLSAAEKTGLINITDITGGNDDRFQPVIYSTEEREIGVWEDGKPLYQKTVIITNADKNASYDLGITDFDTYFVCDGSINSTGIIPYLHGTYPDNSIGGFLDNTGSSLAWIFRSGSQAPATISGFITVRYTKTTDTPGSGQWTPQGVPAVHYSTDEQVVGTWINGETLYEKTWYFQSSMVSIGRQWTSLNIDVSNLNIDEIVNHRAQSYSSQSVSIDVWNDSGTLKAQYWLDGLNVGSVTIQYTKSST